MLKSIIAGVVLVATIVGGYVLYAFYKKMQNDDVEIETPVVVAPKSVKVEIPKIESIPNAKWTSNAPQKQKDTTYQYPSNVLDINVDVKKYEDLKIDPTKVLVKMHSANRNFT